jgi:hypothetical protein
LQDISTPEGSALTTASALAGATSTATEIIDIQKNDKATRMTKPPNLPVD